jgi:hypothetical protein
MADIWIKADYPLGPLAQQPIEQAVADVLAKAPWAAWQTGEVPFRYEYIDRPEGPSRLPKPSAFIPADPFTFLQTM